MRATSPRRWSRRAPKLPADRNALQRFVADFAGATISNEVVDLETARGMVDAAADKLP